MSFTYLKFHLIFLSLKVHNSINFHLVIFSIKNGKKANAMSCLKVFSNNYLIEMDKRINLATNSNFRDEYEKKKKNFNNKNDNWCKLKSCNLDFNQNYTFIIDIDGKIHTWLSHLGFELSGIWSSFVKYKVINEILTT